MASADKAGRKSEALIFSVQHFCLHDGPGLRSLVFFKGCPLRCVWCQNPESWQRKPQLAFKAHLCIGCGTCVDICPEQALTEPGHRDSSRCASCFDCVDNCPAQALVRFGRKRTKDEVIAELRPEYAFYKSTRGGVTFSGGEPTIFSGFAAELASALGGDGVHVALETCGWFDLGSEEGGDVWRLIEALDLVIFDLKVFDPARHRALCRADNERIKANLITLAALAGEGRGPVVWPRLPVVPGMTDGRDNLLSWADFLLSAGLSDLTLVPYHNLGESKRQWLGMPPGPDIEALSDEPLDAVRRTLDARGITCYAPSEEDWPG